MPRRISDTTPAAGLLRQQQQRLTTGLVRDLRRIRRLLRLNPRGHANRAWVDAVEALTSRYGQASAALALEFYEAQRALSDARGPFRVAPEDPPSREQVEAIANWAAAALRGDEGAPALGPGEAQRRAEVGFPKAAADVGRRTTLRAVRSDSEAVAWARTAALGACYFCKMLASRGAVYDQQSVRFEAHDSCHCMALPVFRGDRFELSRQAQEWEAIYREFAAPYPGDQLQRFRRALADIEEGRIAWSPPARQRRAA